MDDIWSNQEKYDTRLRDVLDRPSPRQQSETEEVQVPYRGERSEVSWLCFYKGQLKN